MCRIACLFLLQRLKGSMLGDASDFNNNETRAVKFFFSARQGAEGNSRHSDRNITGSCTIVYHRKENGWHSLNVVLFNLCCASSWTTQKSDHSGDYWSKFTS